ncbi:MAG: DUF748 domain-containing protein [Candidatus Rokubacteria bacterium]|nr:DUF748 domain-containing protein [Candidatus Rokubacteria bacterium]
MTRRAKLGLGVLVALLVLGAVVVTVLPEIVRRLAVSQLAQLSGRAVALEDVDLNLFTGRVALKRFRLAQGAGADAALEFERLDVRIGLLSLLTSDIRVRELTLAAATIRAARTGPTAFDFSDLLALIPPSDPTKPATRTLTLERLAVRRATVLARDQVPAPPVEWRIEELSVEGTALTTRAGAEPGRLSVTARLNGAPLALRDGRLALAPLAASGRVALDAFELPALRAYAQDAAGLGPRAGRLTLALTLGLAVGEAGLTRAEAAGDAALDGLELVRGEAAEPTLALARLAVRIQSADLVARTLALASVELDRPALRAVRDAAGRIDLLSLGGGTAPAAPAQAASAPAPTAPAAPFRVAVGALGVTDARVTFADAAVTPATTLVVSGLGVAGRDLAWPGAGGVDVRATTDLAPLAPYLAPAAGVAPAAGRASVALTVAYRRGENELERAAVSGALDVTGLTLRRSGRRAPFATVPRLLVKIREAELLSRVVTLASVEVDGLDLRAVREAQGVDLLALGPAAPAGAPGPAAPAPAAAPAPRVTVERLALRRATVTFRDDTLAPPTTLALANLTATVRDLAWPGPKPAAVELSTDLPSRGRFTLTGRLTPLPVDLDVQTSIRDATIEPYQVYIPVRARFGGSFNGDAHWRIRVKDGAFTAASRGTSWIENLEIGAPGDTPAVRVARLQLDGIDFAWPTHARLAALTLTRPDVRVERGRDGALNLRELFTPPGPAAPPSAAPAAPRASKPLLPLALDFERITIVDGYARFLDRSMTPAFSQTLARLAVTVTGLSSTPGRRAKLAAQGIVGGDAALDLRGEIAPLGELYADLAGELRDFALPSVNPYADSFVAWIMRSGKLGVRFTLRIEHDTLTANNEIAVANLKVEPSGASDEVKKRIGLPLGLIVALVTDSSGGIKFNLPLSGTLSSWTASFGDAIWAAIKNVIVNIIASPFRAIGRLFRSEDKIAELAVGPVTFPAGSAVVTPAMERHLTSVADFLRRAPLIKLALAPVTTPRDVESLRAQELTARIQQLQRERGLPDYAAAVTAEFRRVFPALTPPTTAEEQLARLRERESISEARVAELAARRLDAARDALVKGEGIQGDRLAAAAPAVAPEDGEGRIEFQITY